MTAEELSNHAGNYIGIGATVAVIVNKQTPGTAMRVIGDLADEGGKTQDRLSGAFTGKAIDRLADTGASELLKSAISVSAFYVGYSFAVERMTAYGITPEYPTVESMYAVEQKGEESTADGEDSEQP